MSADRDAPAERVEIAIAVVERDGEFLIGLRPDDVPLAGLWEFPGGKIQPGETATAAAARECLEEAGLVVRVTGSYPAATHDYPHARVRLSFFACQPAEQTCALPPRFRWVPRAELGSYRFPPANAPLLELLTSVRAKG